MEMSDQIHARMFQTEPPTPTERVAEWPQSVWFFGEEKNLLLLPVIELRLAQATATCTIPANVSHRISCFNVFLMFCFKNTERKAKTISLDQIKTPALI